MISMKYASLTNWTTSSREAPLPIHQHHTKYMVTVQRAAALTGFQRIRKTAPTLTAAQDLEAIITEALETYGKWPVEATDKPLRIKATSHKPASVVHANTGQAGTLREAVKLAIANHWAGKRSERNARYVALAMADFFEARGVSDIDALTSADIDAIIKHHRDQGNTASTINKVLGTIRIANQVALKRLPPLATVTIPVPHVTGPRAPKWWLKPEDHKRVVTALRDPIDGSLMTDTMFADFIDVVVYEGLRVEETLRLQPSMVMNLGTDKAWLYPPGTKTTDAENAIPIYPEAVAPLQSAITRAKANGWRYLFPLRVRQAADRWNHVRDYLGASDVPTATLKSLRRTFAWYANTRGMPTATLQKVLRHQNISTTQGYLDLIGDQVVDNSRKYFEVNPTQSPAPTQRQDIGSIIQAYATTPGVTPEDVARFAKELMT